MTLSQPTPITSTALFPLGPTNAARDKLTSLLNSTKEVAERLAQSHAIAQSSSSSASGVAKQGTFSKEAVDRAEVHKLQKVVETLRTELGVYSRQLLPCDLC